MNTQFPPLGQGLDPASADVLPHFWQVYAFDKANLRVKMFFVFMINLFLKD